MDSVSALPYAKYMSLTHDAILLSLLCNLHKEELVINDFSFNS